LHRRTFLFLPLLSSLSLLANSSQPWHLGKYGNFTFENAHNNIYIMHGVISTPDDENIGFITNPAFIETKNGLILIDPGGSYEIGLHVFKQIKNITSKPIIAIFNTHDHNDHWFANAVFKEAYPNAIVYAHTKMQEAAIELYGGKYRQRGFSFDKAKRICFADVALEDGETLVIDGETFYIQHPQNAHTNNDISISHRNSNTIFMGDLLMSKALANFGLHSSILGNISFLEKIEQEKPYDLYVAGHGPSGSREEAFMPYLTYLRIIKEEVQTAYDGEVSLNDFSVLEEKIRLRLSWEENLSFSHQFVNRYMHHIYSELETSDNF